MGETFEDTIEWECVKLTNIHANTIIRLLEKFSQYPCHIRDIKERVITRDIEETSGIANNIIEKYNGYADSSYDVVYSGPHLYVCQPFYKSPYTRYRVNNDYDVLDLSKIEENYGIRALYKRKLNLDDYVKFITGFQTGQDRDGKPLYDNWIDHYKFAYRRMLGNDSEHTFIGAILAPGYSHIHTINSITFRDVANTVEFAGLAASIPIDFFVKVLGANDLTEGRVETIPFGISDRFKTALFIRTLMLNCLTKHYSDLWAKMWKEEYKQESWSIEDKRLKSFSSLTEQWQWAIPLRNYFERRQALVEIDVIAAMALGLSLQDLEMIYTIQFPVLQQNENDTWYDAEGKIVFTCSRGLTGVGLDRPAWNAMRGNPIMDADGTIIAYEGAEPQYTHIIDPRKSELYGGQQQTFIAPYNRCDRIADYRTAWAHFEKMFNK